MPIAERQSEWIADVIEGKVAVPGRDEMLTTIAKERRAVERRYVASKRHTIQVDGPQYMHLLARERKRNRVRGAATERQRELQAA